MDGSNFFFHKESLYREAGDHQEETINFHHTGFDKTGNANVTCAGYTCCFQISTCEKSAWLTGCAKMNEFIFYSIYLFRVNCVTQQGFPSFVILLCFVIIIINIIH